MSDTQLVALSLADEESAQDLLKQLDAIDKLDENIKIVDAAIAVKSGRGKVKLKQSKGMGFVKGVIGGLMAHFYDAGIDDDLMRQMAQDLGEGKSALFILYKGDWSKSSAVLQDALQAHGIRYVDQSLPSSMVAAAQSASEELGADEAEVELEVEIPEPAPEAAIVEDVPAEPASDEADEVEETDEDAALAAAVAAAADATRAADAQAYAGQVQDLSNAVGMAGSSDTGQGVEMLDASSQVGEMGARVGLLSLERRNSGLELGRMAGELSVIGQEVGEQDMPILSAILADRSARLQRIAAETVASTATVREMAALLDAAGGQIGDLGADEVGEGALRMATARALVAHAAEVGAAGLALEDQTAAELASVADDAAPE